MARRIDVPNVPAEYAYTRSLVCQKCGATTSASRKGSSSRAWEGYMIDHWEVQCTSCSHTEQLEFNVPNPVGAALFSELKEKIDKRHRNPWWKFW